MDDAADSARGTGTERSPGHHAVVADGHGRYALWPGGAGVPEVPQGWRRVYGPAGAADCRAYVEREWRPGELGFEGAGGEGSGVSGVSGVSGGSGGSDADTVVGRFRAQVARTPEAVAVEAADVTLRYRELDAWSDRLAAALRERGVGPEQVVPVCLERGPALVAAWLAVLKAGGALLPLDPGSPARRLAGLVDDCGARVAITEGDGFEGVTGVAVDATGGAPGGAAVGPDGLAYLIYTSGTTGHPKGVAVGHRALLFTLERVIDAYGLRPGDRVPQLAALGFDTALEQVFAPLLAGATVVPGGALTWAPTELAGLLGRLGLTSMDLTPAYWHQLLGLLPAAGPAPHGLRLVVVGGDVVHADDCRDSLARLPGVRLLNAYGVTEAAVTSTLCEVTAGVLGAVAHAGHTAPVPIGRPLPGVRVHVLDAALNPVRPGEKGGIHLAGPGLARGYWREPGLTAESFLPDPYAPTPGERMYRTGDAGRWRADGQLEILGRFDDQVKVLGHRVDPAEIEAVLAAHPGVRQARVTADGTAADGSRTLTAYYTGPAGGEDLRAYLGERLPSYLVPAAFVALEAMPLTPAGKIDRRRLPHTEPLVRPAGAPGPANAGEAALAQLWAELLGVEPVGPEDDFFALGGTSLLAMEMLARARIVFGFPVGEVRTLTRALLRDPTLRAFAAALAGTASAATAPAGTASAGADADTAAVDWAVVDWAAEARLAVPVRQSWSPAPSRADPAEILLTGATGFCGAHLLHALLATTRARVHCLVRAPDEEHALERLRAAQQRYLRHDLADPRVVPLVGDLTAPRLGLADGLYRWLADHLDAVHHLGGQVNFLYPYHQLRAANVEGTREVVRLAGHSRGVPVHYLSTLAVLAGFGAAGVAEVSERTPLAYPERLGVGYVESKWVAEQLLHEAAAAGLPVTVLRTNDVTGDLASGAMNPGTELCALIAYFADSGTFPDVRLPLDFVPADRFAGAIAHIAAHAPADGEVYHLTSPSPATLPELAARMRAHGHRISELPYGDWVRHLVRFAAGHPRHPIAPFVPLFVDRAPGGELSISELYFRPTFPRFDRENADTILAGSGTELPRVDGPLLDHYLRRMAADGLLGEPR
ncbi:amino acid adenylation domain-containing protein [Kitasatospora sp. NPDC051170]|uniref:amino acid adenylation domain-containing protein n=1 Tax=Kitasatospora sp. NPDC051170 TaxID=3364056 RepID=UPI0037BB2393